MNIDFMLPKTPACARKLVHISNICNLDLDLKIIELAQQGLVVDNDEIMPLAGIRKDVTQFILDSGFRCGILRCFALHDIQNLIVNAIKLADFNGAITVVDGVGSWKSILKTLKFADVKHFSLRKAMNLENQKERRDGILILEWDSLGESSSWNLYTKVTALGREFPKTIIVGSIPNQWTEIAACLYPELPDPRENSIIQFPKNPDKASIFYNVFLPNFDTLINSIKT